MKGPVLGCVMVLASLFSYETGAQNIALESREYKVGIAVDRMPREAVAVAEAIRMRLNLIKKIEPRSKRQSQVQFLDTDSCALAKNAMLLRARTKPGGKPRLTLKIRNPDILAVDTMPIALASKRSVGIEDDYSIGNDGKPPAIFPSHFHLTVRSPTKWQTSAARSSIWSTSAQGSPNSLYEVGRWLPRLCLCPGR